MRRIILSLLVIPAFLIGILSQVYASDTLKYVRKGYILKLVDNDKTLDEEVVGNLIDTYFTVYPVLVRNFNEGSVKEVSYLIDPGYKGVAEAGNGRVRISPHWLKDHPNDFDLVTHEVMHLVQAYPQDAGPWWVTEGIADYVRYVYGVDNEKGGWTLPEYNSDQNFDKGYRVTARFFLWIENKVKPGFIKQLDHSMRTDSYSNDIWKNQTGMTIEELWETYGKNPVI